MAALRRFWFEFDKSVALPPGVVIGCGITAADREDAMSLLRDRVFKTAGHPVPRIVVEDIDIRSLDVSHVRPNMANPAVRCVWFPMGY